MRLNSKKRGKGKKGISPLIGYVLLVVFAVVISSIVFQWLRTYVPAQAMECPDGVSLFLNNATFDSDTKELSLTMTNNGRFSIDGYYINIKNDSEQDLAVIGIWNCLDEEKSFPAQNFSGYISFDLQQDINLFRPQNQATHVFNIPEEYGEPYSVSIIPIRRQEHRERERLVSCGGARVEQTVGKGGEEEEPPEECGDETCDSGECTAGCTNDCDILDCCGIEGCNEDIGETCSNCPGDCGECPIVQIGYFGFESGAQGWSDTGSDSDRSNARSKVQDNGAEEGLWSFHLQDDTTSSITAQNFDFTGYESVTISWWGYYRSFWGGLGSNECVELKINNIKVNSWGGSECGNHVTEDIWLEQSATVISSEYTFDDSVEIRFEGEMGSDWDDFYVDGINITGIPN